MDILNRYICVKCGFSVLDFVLPTSPCSCTCVDWRVLNSANTAATTANIFGAQFDSIDTIDEDVQSFTAQDQLERDWKKVEEARRGDV